MASLKIFWNSVTNAVSYNVYYDTTSGVTTGSTLISGITEIYYNHEDLVEGTTYYYKVAGVDRLGNVGALSEEFSALTSTAPVFALLDIVIVPTDLTIATDTTQQFTAYGHYSDSSSVNITGLATWSGNNDDVATVSSTGLLSALTVGVVTVTAEYASVSGTTTVITTGLTSIVITPAEATILATHGQQYTATGHYSNNSTADLTSSVTWGSTETFYAIIDQDGYLTAIAEGGSTIVATLGAISGTTDVTITKTLSSIVVTPADATIDVDDTQQYTATGHYNDGSTADITGDVTWDSSDTDNATISSGGLLTGVLTGSTTVTATLGDISGNTSATLSPVLTSIVVTPAGMTLVYPTTQQYTATGHYNDATTADITGDVTWDSSDTDTATISLGGLVSSQHAGTSTISATLGDISGDTDITVEVTLISIAVTPADATISNGNTQQYTGTGTYNDGSTVDITGAIDWDSSDTDVATVDVDGLATGVGVGSTTISATSGLISGNTGLTVEEAEAVAYWSEVTQVGGGSSTLGFAGTYAMSDTNVLLAGGSIGGYAGFGKVYRWDGSSTSLLHTMSTNTTSLNTIYSPDSGVNIYAGGASNTYLVSSDSGASWTEHVNQGLESSFPGIITWIGGIPSPGYSSDLWGMQDYNRSHSFYHSTDGGSTWTPIVLSLYVARVGFVEPDNTVYLAGYNGYVSYYNGSTFTDMTQGLTKYYLSMWVSDTYIYVAGYDTSISNSAIVTRILKASPHTATTLTVASSSGIAANAISGIDDTKIWLAMADGSIRIYNSGTSTFDADPITGGNPVGAAFYSIAVSPSHDEAVFAGGSGGHFYKRDALIPIPDDIIYVAGDAVFSRDAYGSWSEQTYASSPVGPDFTGPTYVKSPTEIFMLGGFYGGPTPAYYIKGDGAGNWTTHTFPGVTFPPTTGAGPPVFSLYGLHGNGNTIAVVGSWTHQFAGSERLPCVFRTTDGGTSWTLDTTDASDNSPTTLKGVINTLEGESLTNYYCAVPTTVWVNSSSDIFAGLQFNTIGMDCVRWNGSSWSPMIVYRDVTDPTRSGAILTLYSDSTHIYVSGYNSVGYYIPTLLGPGVAHSSNNGATFTYEFLPEPVATEGYPVSMNGSSGTNVWIAYYHESYDYIEHLYHTNGAGTWTELTVPHPSPDDYDIYTVGVTITDVWVSLDVSIVRYNVTTSSWVTEYTNNDWNLSGAISISIAP